MKGEEAEVTDEPELRQLGGFRTPLAAGMLSGVLAGVASIIIWYMSTKDLLPHGSLLIGIPGLRCIPLDLSVQILPYMFLCCGPAVARRSLKLAGLALLWALAFLAVDLEMFNVQFALQRLGVSAIMALWKFGVRALPGAWLGFALTRLYSYKPYSKWAPLLGAAFAVLSSLSRRPLLVLVAGPGASDSRDMVVVNVMWELIVSVVLVVVPTAAIEYAKHKQARSADRSSVLTGGNP